MANVKISALPITTATTINDYFVKNNSGETTTNKVQVKNVLGLTRGTGVDSLKSASFLSSIPSQSTGIGSVAIGNNSEAKADGATAVGDTAEVFDNVRVYGTALGYNTRVAQYSTAVGNQVTAVGAYSVGIGSSTQATGGSDVAIGRAAKTQGSNSIAIGYNAESYNNNGIAIGTDSDITASEGVALGRQAIVTAQEGVAIGYGSTADEQRSVAFQGLNTAFADTLHMRGIYTFGNNTDISTTSNGGSGHTLNFDTTSTWKVVLDQSASLVLTNVRNGAHYRILFDNTGSYNLTSVTAAGYNIKYNGGNRNNLTHNSDDIWKLDVIGGEIFVTQTSNYA